MRVTYSPDYPDGGPDPGEVVWAKVRFEDDRSQSKDRPVLVIGRVEGTSRLAAIQFTSQASDRRDRVSIGAGPWDASGRSSSVKLGRIVQVEEADYRREGAVLPRAQFDDVIGRLAAHHRTPVTVEQFYNACHDQNGRFCSAGGGRFKSVGEAVAHVKGLSTRKTAVDISDLDIPGHGKVFHGIGRPRSAMPQFPGKEAGHEDRFTTELSRRGIGHRDYNARPLDLKATQNEIDGTTVGAIVTGGNRGKGRRLIVSNDGYVLDGHHRWAGELINSLTDKSVRIPVRMIDLPIKRLLHEADAYNGRNDIETLKLGQNRKPTAVVGSGRVVNLAVGTAVFACFEESCAPPPVGRGGSSKAGTAAHSAARQILRQAKSVEPRITKSVQSVIEEGGGRMEGLEYRVKGLGSLRRKIIAKAVTRSQTVEEAASKVTDAVRYTAVIPERGYTKAIRATLGELQVNGFTVHDLETHWTPGQPYNGVHVLVTDPKTKVTAEVQFHTERSLVAKHQIHDLYDEYRSLDTTPERRVDLYGQMVTLSDNVPRPRGAQSIGQVKVKA